MLIYIVIGALIILIGAVAFKKSNPNRGMFLLLLMLAVFAGIRGEFTSDHSDYIKYFDYISSLSFKEVFSRSFVMEKGFVVLSKFIGCISDSPVFYMLLISFVTLCFYFAAFKKYSVMPWLTVLLFVSIGDYYGMFNLTRQVLAAAICFWATKYINESKLDGIKYAICIILASTIHQTALIMLPMYFLLRIKTTWKSVVIYTGMGTIAYVFLPQIIDFFQSIFPKYKDYQWGMGEGSFNSVIASMAVLIFTLVSIYFLHDSLEMEKIENRKIMNGVIFTIIFLILGTKIYMVSRMAYFFKPFVCVMATNTIMKYKSSRNRFMIIIIVSIISLLYTGITLSGTAYNPYFVHGDLFA